MTFFFLKKKEKQKMEEFKHRMKTVIKEQVIEQSRDGRDCIGCFIDDLAHTCETTMVEKIENEFNRTFFNYFARNVNQVQNRLGKAILIELLSDEMPRWKAIVKASEIPLHNHITCGGGSTLVTSSTEENQ